MNRDPLREALSFFERRRTRVHERQVAESFVREQATPDQITELAIRGATELIQLGRRERARDAEQRAVAAAAAQRRREDAEYAARVRAADEERRRNPPPPSATEIKVAGWVEDPSTYPYDVREGFTRNSYDRSARNDKAVARRWNESMAWELEDRHQRGVWLTAVCAAQGADVAEIARLWKLSELLVEISTERLIADVSAQVRLEVTTELLATEFALGDGVRVTWGDATMAQHAQRVAMLERHVSSTAMTAARHAAAITLLTTRGAHCLASVARTDDLLTAEPHNG